ncbi:MAG: hypothetical protein ACOCZS_02315 [Verrucomicrobiota bacterium]
MVPPLRAGKSEEQEEEGKEEENISYSPSNIAHIPGQAIGHGGGHCPV